MKYIDVEQNTDEWYSLRCGKITSSALGKVMANYGKAFGEPAKKYAIDIALEQVTGKPVSSGYTNEHMQRGIEQEPLARMKYEEEQFCEIKNGGFFDLGNIGCSPDGLVDDDGLIEIKCAIPSIHFERIKRQTFDSSYKWQIIGNLYFTQRDWIDFVSYCPEFPESSQLYTHRSRKDEFTKEFSMIDERIDQFLELIADSKRIIQRGN